MIEFKEVAYGYSRQREVLQGVTLSLERGHIYGLLGKNGVGKSTLLQLIGGLISPQKGEVAVEGVLPKRRLPSFLSSIYYLPEQSTFPKSTMEEYQRVTAPFYPKFDKALLLHYMEEFGVSCKQKLHTLSSGERKKAHIAFALACNTPVLLMDEPTNGLDIPAKSQFRRIISQLASEERCIVIATHQVRDLEFLIDTLVVLEGSQLVLDAPIEVIERKLLFTHLEGAGRADALYQEPILGGVRAVLPNEGEMDSRIDIELFFNAAVSNPNAFRNLFRKL